jgi:hypothetical protein
MSEDRALPEKNRTALFSGINISFAGSSIVFNYINHKISAGRCDMRRSGWGMSGYFYGRKSGDKFS